MNKNKDIVKLTATEKKILDALFNTTLSNKAIADSIGASLASVKFHAFNIYKKLCINKRIELKDLDRKHVMGLIK